MSDQPAIATEAKVKVKKKSVIEPAIKFEGDEKEHATTAVFEADDSPTIKSVGIVRLPNGYYSAFTMYTKGTEVVKVEVEEPNLRAIAEESAKIAFVHNFCHDEI